MKVIGAGYARTGTLSLKAALEMLGVGPCLHPLDGDRRPAPAVATAPGHDAEAWREWLAPWRATLGWVGARHYRELMEAFPEAIVLLSVRDPDAWYRSYASCVRRARELALAGDERSVAAGAASEALLLRGERSLSEMLDGRAAEREHALERYRRHNAEVMSVVPRERLLVWDVAEGWAPLCERLRGGRARGGLPAPEHRAGVPGPPGRERRRRRRPRRRRAWRGSRRATRPDRSARTRSSICSACAATSSRRASSPAAGSGAAISICSPGRRPARCRVARPPARTGCSRTPSRPSTPSASILREIGVVVSASLYSLGGPTLAHRLVEHYAMAPATDKYHVVGVGCASAVPLVRLTAQTLSAHPGARA